METEQIEAFLTLVKTKNFTRAAEELNVVQSTITARIKMLEQSVGKELFKRETRKVIGAVQISKRMENNTKKTPILKEE